MVAKKTTKKEATNRVSATNGAQPKVGGLITVPSLNLAVIGVRLVGTTGLLTNSIKQTGPDLGNKYSGAGPSGKAKAAPKSLEEMYLDAMYVLADSKHAPPSPKASYGIPTSGILKCIKTAIRLTGINDNTTVGKIQKSIQVRGKEQCGHLSRIKFKELVKDNRPAAVKGVPSPRCRPMFNGWTCDLDVTYNPLIMEPKGLLNLILHAGFYVGLCEMRAEKGQGECGGFTAQLTG